MRWLISALAIASLAGCSQEQWDYAETPPPDPQPTIKPAVDPVPAPAENVTPPIQPEAITPPKPPTTKVVEPVVVEPLPKPPEPTPPKTTPEEPNLSPSEIVARKLISDNPEENLEVLNDALQAWIAAKGTLPEKIGDLVAEELLPMLPMAPQGKIFTIDRDAKVVVLVAKE
jgi:hypothetical protein